jgi:hypothetical protein
MKTIIATAAALAAVATLSAAPAMAESTVNEQQYKLQRILKTDGQAQVQAKTPRGFETPARSQSRLISARMLTGPEKAQTRLSRVQPDAANGGR